MLYPQLGAQYYDEKDRGLLNRMETFYAEAITPNQVFWSEADLNSRFEAGDQTAWSDYYGNVSMTRKRQFSFNRIRPTINAITGYQRRNRKSIVAVPIENADNETADQFSKVLMWCCKKENILETISDAFHGSLITGMNLLHVWVDYRNDPVSGNIKVDNASYNSFVMDPFWKKGDLSDCNGIWKRTYVTKLEAMSLLPNSKEEILGLNGSSTSSNRDGKFQFMAETYNYSMKNLLTYDEFYYRDYRAQKMLVDRETGDTLEWKAQDDEKLAQFLQLYPQITLIEQEIPTVNMAIVVQGRVFYDGPNVLGIDSYPFVPVYAYYNPQIPYLPWRIQGVVTGLRDPQYLYNHRRLTEFDILESTVNSGWLYKANALVDPSDVFKNGQGKGIAVKEDASLDDLRQIQSPVIPPTTIQLSELLSKEINHVSGVNDELLGSAVDDKAGVLSMLRQGAGLTTLQPLFDNLDMATKNLGKLMIDIIQSNFTPGKVKKILEGEEPSPQFHNKAFGIYHANVEEGLNTSTQKQMQFAQMLELKEMGLPIAPEDLLEAATFQNKERVIKHMEQTEQAQIQSQQQAQQIEQQLQLAQIELAQARAKADIGLFAERTSRVEENRSLAVERIAEANKQDELALLNKLKIIKELETMDLSHLEKYINMSNSLKQSETANTYQTEQSGIKNSIQGV